MPIYEFRCAQCEHVQEVIVTSSNASSNETEMTCGKCGGEELERILSTVSYAMGAGKSDPGPNVSTRTCGGNTCGSLEIPGPAR